MIQIKRAYEQREKSDGYRVLVDRLWPRGLSKATLHADLWLKEVAPSTELRKWFGHDPEKWREFRKKYKAELKDSKPFEELRRLVKEHPKITLVYGAKDEAHNQAVVMKALLGD